MLSQAGKYFAKCGQYSRAVGLYLQCGDRMLDEAIKVWVFVFFSEPLRVCVCVCTVSSPFQLLRIHTYLLRRWSALRTTTC